VKVMNIHRCVDWLMTELGAYLQNKPVSVHGARAAVSWPIAHAMQIQLPRTAAAAGEKSNVSNSVNVRSSFASCFFV